MSDDIDFTRDRVHIFERFSEIDESVALQMSNNKISGVLRADAARALVHEIFDKCGEFKIVEANDPYRRRYRSRLAIVVGRGVKSSFSEQLNEARSAGLRDAAAHLFRMADVFGRLGDYGPAQALVLRAEAENLSEKARSVLVD